MISSTILALVFAAALPQWQTDYDQATQQAIREKKDLVVYFHQDGEMDHIFDDETVKERLKEFVCLRLPASYEYDGKRLLEHPSFGEMMGRPGLSVVSFRYPQAEFYQEVISAHPLHFSRYWWAPHYGAEEVKIILDLPAATLSQRSMIYAVRVHPERPQSVYAQCHPAFLGHAERHSERQASMLNQHHADIIGASYQLGAQVGEPMGNASEVVAESWGNFVGGENVLEAAFSCVDAWRHSSGHWGAVSRPHRFFGYDIARGSNGTWYATGIFAD